MRIVPSDFKERDRRQYDVQRSFAARLLRGSIMPARPGWFTRAAPRGEIPCIMTNDEALRELRDFVGRTLTVVGLPNDLVVDGLRLKSFLRQTNLTLSGADPALFDGVEFELAESRRTYMLEHLRTHDHGRTERLFSGAALTTIETWHTAAHEHPSGGRLSHSITDRGVAPEQYLDVP